MTKPTGPTNPQTRALVKELEKKSREQKVALWADIAERLQKPARHRAYVNVNKLERICKKGDTVIIPGKLLAAGNITKAIKVASLNCSATARAKIDAAGGKYFTLNELIKENPKGKNVRIIK